LVIKISLMLLLFLWFRATFPRYRYDQIMRLGWKVFIPVTLVWLFVVGLGCAGPGRSVVRLSGEQVMNTLNSLRYYFKSFMLWELLLGLRLTGRYLFSKKITVQYPEELTPLSPRFRGCTPNAAIQTAKSAALPASCAKLFARRWRLRLSRSSVPTVRRTHPL
jgi:hypothetical protein